MIRELEVSLDSGAYPIRIGQGLLSGGPFLSSIEHRNCLIVCDSNVAPLYARPLMEHWPNASLLVLPPGEDAKTPETLLQVLQAAAQSGLQRDGCMVAIGGGVIGDLTGLAAATYMRGVDVVQVPTSLLAMVDAAVGGKTAVNLPQGKNLMGAFHQPKAVWIDLNTLTTLPNREFRAGLAEVVKYAIVLDGEFFAWLESHSQSILDKDPQVLGETVARCCALKAEVVASDERENGPRALLNFGHTLAHAIEKVSGYGSWLHGEAVALGMLVALRLSELKLGLHPDVRRRCEELLKAWGLPVVWPGPLPWEDWLHCMGSDKKNRSGQLGYVLCPALGQGCWQFLDDTDLLREACSVLTPLDSKAGM